MVYPCHVCGSSNTRLLYQSEMEKSLTSGSQVLPLYTRAWQCLECSHVLSEELPNAQEFYADLYRANLYHEDEDQLYEVVEGIPRYRTDHQLFVMQQKISFFPQQKVLDFGCAKSSMMKKILQAEPELDCHFYDVSEDYRSYWEKMTTADKCAVNQIPPAWRQYFDLVTSFFSLEHIADLRTTVAEVTSLLCDEGTFYIIVPDMFNNVSDLMVVDHVNHFTVRSMQRLLQEAGLTVIDIDVHSHRGAMTVVAKKLSVKKTFVVSGDYVEPVTEIATFWRNIGQRMQQAESNSNGAVAIYGAGFYGAFVHANLAQPEQIVCFLDNNVFLQGRLLSGIPILPPAAIPAEVTTVFVALNPKIASSVMESMPFIGEGRQLIYMVED